MDAYDNNKRFIAFSDISGFKGLMKKDKDIALKVLRRFFKIGFEKTDPDIGNYERSIQGLFISDCCILWTQKSNHNELHKFNLLLHVVQDINKAVLDDQDMKSNDILLKTSIAYGEFEYVDTQKHELIQKELIFGDAYIRAYEDNSLKLDPGLCRIVIDKKFPVKIKNQINKNANSAGLVPLIKKKEGEYYFFWNCVNKDNIDTFWNEYSNSKKEMYKKMHKSLSRRYDI
jgi:hypothetical protein